MYAKLFVILDCSFIFSSDWVYLVVGRPLISFPIGGFLSTSSAEPLLNSRGYRGVFVDTKRQRLKALPVALAGTEGFAFQRLLAHKAYKNVTAGLPNRVQLEPSQGLGLFVSAGATG